VGGGVATVFSAPRYCGDYNIAAVMDVDEAGRESFATFESVVPSSSSESDGEDGDDADADSDDEEEEEEEELSEKGAAASETQ
jgi:hypothetical protein